MTLLRKRTQSSKRLSFLSFQLGTLGPGDVNISRELGEVLDAYLVIHSESHRNALRGLELPKVDKAKSYTDLTWFLFLVFSLTGRLSNNVLSCFIGQ